VPDDRSLESRHLHLGGYGGETIGVTSGGKGSWHPKLAKQLRDKRVIVMPDNDAPGEAYAEAVRASLDAENWFSSSTAIGSEWRTVLLALVE
jgi:5S rRNA maturation endonuclease (ribonuclease M5)